MRWSFLFRESATHFINSNQPALVFYGQCDPILFMYNENVVNL